ncbi:MAG: polyphosphate polymerase domain-containing protein [Eubacterium sp.]|nr:polyphosphate polymerase domain-containing protein [Eubacterium sp.]
MQNNESFRHELKYPIHYADYLGIRQRLRPVMRPDEYTAEDGRYLVRSVYFDNLKDDALREKMNGIAKREKFRLRYYNDDFSFIALEKKIKINSLCRKLDAKLTVQEYKALLQGDVSWMMGHSSELVKEFYCKLKGRQLRPRVLVSYLREPYVYAAGNVRVTFDSHIRSSLFHQCFLEKSAPDIGVAEAPGDMIMEVKFDAFLPEVIQTLLQTAGIRQQAYSKYSACRRFG